MGSDQRIEYLSYESVADSAESFLSKHNALRRIPVPIEDIVELELDIGICPIPGLQDITGVDAYILPTFDEIMVDQFVLEHRLNRYRFSLAHEIGHLVLHQGFLHRIGYLEALRSIKDPRDYPEIVNRMMSDKEYSRLEYQANCFSGLSLVPRDSLKENFLETVEAAIEDGADMQIPIRPVAAHYVGSFLSRQFQVSAKTMEIRLREDNLIQQ